MGIFIDIEDPELRDCLEERLNIPGNQTPVITKRIHVAKVIVCDGSDRRHFTALGVKKVKILNPSEEQLRDFQILKKGFPWVKTEVQFIEL